MIQFAQTAWLYAAGAAALGLALMFHYGQRSRQNILRRFAAAQLLARLTGQVSIKQRRIKQVLLIVATVCICTALARPQVGFQWEAVKRKGIDIMLALDTSNSMLATDVKPDRLTRSKLGIIDFVRKLDGDRVGLIVFAGTAFPLCPLTMDYQAFDQSLAAVNTDIIPIGGTDIPAAIAAAEQAFAADANHKLLVLITDGENLEGDAIQAARKAAEQGITIFTVGVGTPAGELIPRPDAQDPSQFLRDARGKVVQSRLDEHTLRAMAEAAGGMYQPLGQQAQGLETIYQQKLTLIPKQDIDERLQQIPLERFQWLILAAVLFLCLEYLLNDRKRGHGQSSRSWAAKLSGPAVVLLTLCSLVGPLTVSAAASQAFDAYQRGAFAQALEQYRQEADQYPDDARRQFNLGAAAYKTGQYEQALDAFEKSLQSDDLALHNQTYYNMGNAWYRLGERTLATAPQQTMSAWQRAIESYDHALKLDAQDQQAQNNQAIVKKRLEQLQKQMPPNQSGKNKQDKDKQDKDQSDSSDQDSDASQSADQSQQNADRSPPSDESDQNPASQPDKSQSPDAPPDDEQQAAGASEPRPSDQKPAPDDGAEQSAASAQPTPADENEAGSAKAAASRTGQMTENEATALLDALKEMETGMNALFVTPPDQPSGQSDPSLKNW